jgi:proline iminopeptidase
MEKLFITLRDGKKIYVEIHNKGHKDNLLMLHGGPGEGCGDFQYQANKLSEYFNVIIFDQRGVLRSDKIEINEQFGLDYLIDDCENLKNILGIKRWYVLGHSFGGEIALIYATKNPESVEKVIFENPTFYYPMSIRYFYKKCIEIANQDGNYEYAKKLSEFINNTDNIKLLAESMREIPIDIIIKADHKSETSPEIETINSIRDVKNEQWGNGIIHFERLQEEGKMNENFLPLISKMKCSSLLILGKYDSFISVEQIESYTNDSYNGKIVTFDKSGHRPHDEEPNKFTETVTGFLND